MLSWLYMVPFNTGESKKNKLINVSIDGNTDGKNYVVSKRKQSFFFWYIKRLTIRTLLSYTFDIPSIIIISYRIKNKKQFIFFLRASIISILLSNIANFHHLAFNVISFNSYLVLFNRAKSNLTLTWNWNSMKKKYTQNISQLDYLSTLRGNNKLSVSTKLNKA